MMTNGARVSQSTLETVLQAVLARVASAPERLADILDAAVEPLIAFTPERFIVGANTAGAQFFGYDRGELVSRAADLIVPQRFRQPNAPPLMAVDDLTIVEIPGLHREGREIPTTWTYGCARVPGGPIFVMLVSDSGLRARRERELEDRFRAVYQNALDGIILMDDDLQIVDANPAACRLLGRAREAVVGARSIDFMPAGERGTADRMGELRSVGALAAEGPILRGDGSIRRAEFGAVANVSPGLHLSIFRDIEDRKRAEEAQRFLDEAGAALGASLDYDETLARVARLAVPRTADWAAIDLVEDDGSFRRVAVAHIDPAKIALAHELRERQRPSIGDLRGAGAVVRTGKPELIELVTDEMLVAALGHRPDLLELIRGLGLVSAMLVPLSARGKVIGAISFVSAESKRRYGPADLAFAQELSRRAGYAMENALYVRDLELANQMKDLVLGRAQHLQATATQLVRAGSVEAIAEAFAAGEPGAPIVARGWSMFSRSGDVLEVVAATPEARNAALAWSPLPLSADTPLAEAARTGRAVWLENREQLLARYPSLGTNARSDVEARAAIPLGTGHETIGVMGVLFDKPRVFDREEREYLTAVANLWAQALHRAQLAEAEREAIRRALEAETVATRKKDEFMAMLGHELRNPLAPIVTATSLLRVRGRATTRELEILDRQARHLVRLVDDLLDISRITSGKLTLKRGRVEIAEVVAQAIESTTPIFEERRIRLFFELPLTPMFVDGDRERLVQVVGNILVNAAKFTPAGKAVFVSGGAANGEAFMVVRDEGRGIEPELLPQVFDLFSQGKQGSDRANGGLGLGLAIARSIALAHGGSIDLDSPGVEQGTTVTVRLPLAEAVRTDGAGTTGRAESSATATPGRHRVLIVDDNEDSALMLAEFLGEMGYECFVALDAARALAMSRELIPDAAILDIGLPDVDGHELAREIRTALAERAPKLIALTGYARESDRERAMEAGFSEHLAKPVEMAKLTAKLNGLLASAGGPEGHPAREAH